MVEHCIAEGVQISHSVVAASVVDVVDVEAANLVVHLGECSTASLERHIVVGEVFALLVQLLVQWLVVHAMSSKELDLDLLALARAKVAQSNLGAPATVTNGSAFQVRETAAGLHLVHEHWDVDSAVALCICTK